jgi:asparagine synthase (glutamine-hydrolysing)
MRSSTELREPFLDHTLFELAFRQPAERKIHGGEGKRLLRSVAREIIPEQVALAPKRPVQTPQREWLRGPLKGWASEQVETALDATDWFDANAVREAYAAHARGESTNSFYLWQWISAGMILGRSASRANA